MMKLPTVLTACMLLVYLTVSGQCGGLTEIGTKYTITAPANVSSHTKVIWKFNGEALFEVDKNGVVGNKHSNVYTGSLTQLTILNVTKNHLGYFRRFVENTADFSWILRVYKRAPTVECEPLTLIGNYITITCTADEVHPQANCRFHLQNKDNINDTMVIKDGTTFITYNHTDPQQKETEYYNTSCTLQYHVYRLTPGNWTVQVNMYPDLPGVSLAQGTSRNAPNTLLLSVPTVNITCDTNVRHGYIRQGESAVCKCARAHAGNPPGRVGWSSTQGENFRQTLRMNERSSIIVTAPDTFTCKSESVLDGSHSANYTPEYAYGPTHASVTFEPPGPFYLCPNQQTNITITCQVPVNSFNPGLLFVIREGSDYIARKGPGDTAWSKSGNYSLARSGHHKFLCRAENKIFGDIFVINSTNLHVYFYISIEATSVKKDETGTWVMPGSDIKVTCSVAQDTEVYINSMNLTCGPKTSTNGTLSVTNVTSDMTCQCVMEQNTTTLCNGDNLTENITIQTAYGPNEVTISLADGQFNEVQNEPFNLCIFNSEPLTVMCVVKKSDVRPELKINDLGLNESDAFTKHQVDFDQSGENYTSKNKIILTGGDHTLVCVARNPQFSVINRTQSMTVKVREPPRDPPQMFARSSQHGDILVPGDNITVTCNVSGGYPSVESVTLTCGRNKSVTSNGTSTELTLTETGTGNNETNCTCQATHVTRCYYLKDVLRLDTMMFVPTQSEIDGSPLIGAAVGGTIGAFVVVVVGVIFCIKRGGKQKDSESSDRRGYDNLAHEPGLGYVPHLDPTVAFKDNSELYGAAAKEYSLQQDPKPMFRDNSELYATASQEPPLYATPKDNKPQPTMSSSKALPEKYNPETGLNPYDEIDTEELKKKQKLFATTPKAKPTTGARPKLPSVPKPSVKIKAKPKGSKNNPKDKVTTVAPEGPPFQSANVYEEVQLNDEGNNRSVSSLASNPDILDNVPAEGPGGPPKPSASNYEEVEIIDQVDKQTGSLSSNPGSSDEETSEGSEGSLQHSTNNYGDVDLIDQVKEESDSLASDSDLSDDETAEGSGEIPQHSTSNYDEVDFSDSVKKQTG